MLDSKKNLKKINFLYCFVCVLCILLYAFGVQWEGTTIITQLPLMNNDVFGGIIQTINNFIGNTILSSCFVAMFTYIFVYYVLIVFPIWLWHFIRGCFSIE